MKTGSPLNMRAVTSIRAYRLASMLALFAWLATWSPSTSYVAAQDPPDAAKVESPAAARTRQVAEARRLDDVYDDHISAGDFDKAVETSLALLAIERTLYEPDQFELQNTLVMAAEALVCCDRFDEARRFARETYESCLRKLGEKNWRTVNARRLLADIDLTERLPADDRRRLARALQLSSHCNELLSSGQLENVAQEGNEALAIYRELLGAQHATTLDALYSVANIASWIGRHDQAIEVLHEVLAGCRLTFSEETCPGGHPQTAQALYLLGRMQSWKEQYDEADKIGLQSLEMYRRVYPPELYPRGHLWTMLCLRQLGENCEEGATQPAARTTQYYDEALAMCRLLYPVDEYPQGHDELISCLLFCAQMGLEQNRFDQALPQFDEAIAMWKQLHRVEDYPQGNRRLAGLLAGRADVLSRLGRRVQALADYEAVLPMYEALYGPEAFANGHYLLSTLYHDLALAYQHTQNPARAQHFARAALAMDRRLYSLENYPNGHRALVESINQLADMLTAQRLYDEVPALLAEAQAMGDAVFPRETYPDGHNEQAETQYQWGSYYLARSQYALARHWYGLALASFKKHYPLEKYPRGSAQIASCLDGIGSALHFQQRYEDAARFFEEALAARLRLLPPEKYPHGHVDILVSLNNLSLPQRALGQFQQAEASLRRALAMALQLYPSAAYPHGSIQIAGIHASLANVLSADKKYAEAAEHYARALEIHRHFYSLERFPLGHASLVYSLLNLESMLCLLGEPADKWAPLTVEAVEIAKRLFPQEAYLHGNPLLTSAVHALAIDHLMLGDTERAIAEFRRVIAWQYEYASHEVASTSTDVMSDYLESLKFDYQALLSLSFHTQHADPELLADLFRWGALRKSLVLDTLVRMRKVQQSIADNEQIRNLNSALHKNRAELAALALNPPPDATAEQLTKLRATLSHETNELENDLMLLLNEHAGAAPADQFSLEAVEAWLAEHSGAAVVEIVYYWPIAPGISDTNRPVLAEDGHYAAFVIAPGRELKLLDLGPARPIDRQIAALRKHIADAPRELRFAEEEELEENYATLASELYRTVFAPLVPHLNGAQTVFLAPDSELNRVVFESLVDDAGNYLIENYAFGYLSSSSDLLRPDAETAGEGVYVFADPAFDLDTRERQATLAELNELPPPEALAVRSLVDDELRGLSWARLPATVAEAASIEELLADGQLGEVEVYTGSTALEEQLKRVLRPRLLHLATHGFYLPSGEDQPEDSEVIDDSRGSLSSGQVFARLREVENPLLRSGLVLAGANTQVDVDEGTTSPQIDDGWITAEEVSRLDLQGTELVVLSACETGLADIRAGENVSGLRRAFLQAGAETLVTSLYKVPDEATQTLMVQFYRRLSEGTGKLAALRAAQLEMIRARRKMHGAAHPFFWASFILVGDPE